MAEVSGKQGENSTSSLELEDDTANELRRTYSYYDYFHKGTVHNWHVLHMFEEFEDEYINLPVPRKSAVPEINTPEEVKREPYHMLPQVYEDEDEVARKQEELEALQDGTHPTTRALIPLGMRFLKVLGNGSQGTAVLFEAEEENSEKRKIVAKYNTPTEENQTDLRDEKERLKSMVGARHIIQRQFIRGYDIKNNGDENEDNPNMYLMEFLEHGTLDSLLRMISARDNAQLYSSELWKIFLCLLRACVAMSYPDRWASGLKASEGDSVPLRDELVPTSTDGSMINPADNALVNLDIAHDNVMIGGYDVDLGLYSHSQVPIFKIIDLGAVSQFPREAENKFSAAVFARIKGKPSCHTPEQFTTAWDAFTDYDTMLEQDDTAGRFGPWTNLYQVGLIMVSIVTQNMYDRPAIGTTQRIIGLQENDFEVFTYGGSVLDDALDHYDTNLRMAIAWTMAHSPLNRPTMAELERIIMDAVNKDFAEEGRVSIADFLGSPPPPIDPTRGTKRQATSSDVIDVRPPKRARPTGPESYT